MASIVVLIRHGKAQARGEGVDDFTRPLTEAGRRAMAATLPDTLAPLGTMPKYLHGTTEIWSSDAHRAVETAEEAAVVLGIPEINIHRCLFEQRFEEFMDEVVACPADVVVAVGHSPFVDDAATRLCGGSVPFKTGALGIFDVSEYAGEPDGSTLRSFSQGPRADRWKTLVEMEGILHDQAQCVRRRMDAFLEAPHDVEALHDFRVAIRTLRSELNFVAPYQKKTQNKSMQKNLRDLVVKTSRLRELDVLTETVSSSKHDCDELDQMCASMRRRECARLTKAIGSKRARKETAQLLERFRGIKWRKDVERFGLASDEVASNFELMAIDFEADYLAADYRDVEATHKLRKDAKRVRYTAREFGGIIGEAARGVPAAMEAVQDELGALCDARVNCDLIESMPRKKLSDEADKAVAALKQDQLDLIDAILGSGEDPEEVSARACDDGPTAEADGLLPHAEEAACEMSEGPKAADGPISPGPDEAEAAPCPPETAHEGAPTPDPEQDAGAIEPARSGEPKESRR